MKNESINKDELIKLLNFVDGCVAEISFRIFTVALIFYQCIFSVTHVMKLSFE